MKNSKKRYDSVAEVKVGEIWADNDPRAVGRLLKIVEVSNYYVCAIVTQDREGAIISSVGKTVRISRQRMFPGNNRGYRKIE